MKRNSFWSIIALCAVVCVGTSSAMEPSQSWYDWAGSGVSSGLSYGKSLYDQLPPMRPNFLTSQQEGLVTQEKVVQEEKKLPEKKEVQQTSHGVPNNNNTPFVIEPENKRFGRSEEIKFNESKFLTAEYGWTPLHLACKDGNEKLVRDLVKNGADINKVNVNGRNPREVALANNHFEIADYLMSFEKPFKIEKKEVKQAAGQSQTKEAVDNKQTQEKNAQNIELPESNTKNGFCESGEYTFQKIGCTGSIFQGGNTVAYSISNKCPRGKIMPPGIYCRFKGEKDLMPITLKSKDGREMVKNQLGSLNYEELKKMNNTRDRYHNFPVCLEKNFGECGRVVIQETISYLDELRNSKKEYTLNITIPGSFKHAEGVFEFTVRKSLYEEQGECLHRFFKQNGICGEKILGVDKNSYTNKKNNTNKNNNTNYRQANK